MAPFVIVLNGTSSSGKTTIAKAIQDQWNGPMLHIAPDHLLVMLGKRHPRNQVGRDRARQFCLSYHELILRGLHEVEFPAILDDVLWRPEFWEGTVSLLNGIPMLLVGVKCSLATLEKREKERGDRNLGTARMQYADVHKTMQYDIEIDSEAMSAPQAADCIIAVVRERFRNCMP